MFLHLQSALTNIKASSS